jgi:hypothetical protein
MAKQMTNSDNKPTHEEIARRAQAIFEQSGRVPGRDMQNWLEAEKQLTAASKTGPQARAAVKMNGRNAAPVTASAPATRS